MALEEFKLKPSLAPIISKTEVMPGVHLTWLEAPQIASIAVPGQFVMVRCGEETLLRRPLSIHQVDGSNNRLALLFATVGKGTRWLSRRKAGDKIDLFGPLGNGFSISPDAKNLLLVAGGIGIAPLHFLAERAVGMGCSVRLLVGAPTKAQIYPRQVLPKGTARFIFTDDGTLGEQGMVTSQLHIHSVWADQIFACGPMPMYDDMHIHREKLLKGKPVQVSLEVMMGCGFGVCYGCTVKTRRGLKQVCKDGPVFVLDDILWDEMLLTDQPHRR